jgi:hypothetical protein
VDLVHKVKRRRDVLLLHCGTKRVAGERECEREGERAIMRKFLY